MSCRVPCASALSHRLCRRSSRKNWSLSRSSGVGAWARTVDYRCDGKWWLLHRDWVEVAVCTFHRVELRYPVSFGLAPWYVLEVGARKRVVIVFMFINETANRATMPRVSSLDVGPRYLGATFGGVV